MIVYIFALNTTIKNDENNIESFQNRGGPRWRVPSLHSLMFLKCAYSAIQNEIDRKLGKNS